MDPTTIIAGGKLMEGIGSLASAFGPKAGNKRDQVRTRDMAYEGAKGASRGALRGAINEGRRHGLHPLASIGAAQSGYSPITTGSTIGDGISALGSAVAQGGEALAGKKLAAKQEELLEAEITEAQSRTLLNNVNARRAALEPSIPTGSQGGMPSIYVTLPGGRDPGKSGKDRGIDRRPTPDQGATQNVSFGNFTGVGPNPEAFEVGLSELAAGALIYGPQWLYDKALEQYARTRERYPQKTGGTPNPRRRSGMNRSR